jgi:hypothetical protein
VDARVALVVAGIRMAQEAVDADAELWVASGGPTALVGAWRERMAAWNDALAESNESLALCFGTLRSLVCDLPRQAPIGDPDWPTVGAVADWCAYALAGVTAQRRRLAARAVVLAAA